MKVYIAAPYTKGDVAMNVNRVLVIADKLLEKGHAPYVPHLTHFWHIVSPKPWDTWLKLDLEFLSICDVVLRLDGESAGADSEEAQAIKLGIPVVHSIDIIPVKVTQSKRRGK